MSQTAEYFTEATPDMLKISIIHRSDSRTILRDGDGAMLQVSEIRLEIFNRSSLS